MMPDECASMRSMARWVLPVLVGPSTAVTPAPRARASRFTGEEKEIVMSCPKGTALPPSGPSVAHWDRYKCSPPQLKNESRTNRGRIADSELSNFVHGHISGCRHHRPPDQVFCREYLERSTLSSRI